MIRCPECGKWLDYDIEAIRRHIKSKHGIEIPTLSLDYFAIRQEIEELKRKNAGDERYRGGKNR